MAGSAVIWGGILTIPIREAMELGFDMRASAMVGLSFGLVAWHLWEDIPMTRGRVWLIDLSGLLGMIAGGVMASDAGPTQWL